MKKKSSRAVETNVPDHDNRPCFFMIILCNGNARHSNSMKIPTNFATTHLPKTVPDRAVLKGPSGDCWNITLSQREEGDITLRHGWKQFYQDHSLGDNEFLLFRHNGNMCFDVQIFDKSGLERKNVPITGRSTHPDTAMKIKEEEIDITETEPPDKVQTRRNGYKRKPITEEQNTGSSSKKHSKAKLCKAAVNFTSKFLHFKRCLTKANVETPFLLTMPASFDMAMNVHKARTEFTFSTASNQTISWKVSLICSETNRVFSKGWRKFAIDNELKMNDSCVFELVAPQEIRVHVFPC
ncbi:hypothetical protein PTKIN_Ptkin10aG0138700 [Pterospermum kingtungense]